MDDVLELWEKQAEVDKDLAKGLHQQSKLERREAFQGNLSFGTGGMRGVMGLGTNRMNVYTLRKANYGLAEYLVKNYKSEVARGVVISHDNRTNSREFAIESAKVLGAFNIPCFMFDSLRTTPELSFSVRYLHAIAGIMITASHNPAKYNGYKIYDEYGCQYTPQYADQVTAEVDKIENVFEIPVADVETMKAMGLLKILGSDVDDAFAKEAESVQLFPNDEKRIKLVYTPLHGTGAEMAMRILKDTGYNCEFVKEQMIHDPLFKTVKLPNPEDPNAFQLSESLGRKIKADLLIATDPDADRVGIGVWNGQEYVYLTGNQTGAILIYFRLKMEKELGILPLKGRVFNTIVTSELGAKIAQSFGFKVTSTLTGFKYIGEQARYLEGTDEQFIFGYEESYGYIIKDYVRDKDSMQSLLAIAEMANWYLVHEDRNLTQVLEEVYQTYGYYQEYTRSIYFEGLDGSEKMRTIMNYYRTADIKAIGGLSVLAKEDYLTSERLLTHTGVVSKLSLPVSDVLKYYLENDCWVVVRPSGTEPKLKIYYAAKADTLAESQAILRKLDHEFEEKISEMEGANV